MSAYNAGNPGSIPGFWRSPAEGNGILAWKIPWMKEPGRLRFMGLQSCTWLSDFTFFSYTTTAQRSISQSPGTKWKWSHSVVGCCCLITNHVWLLWDPMDYSLPGSSAHGFLQARILACIALSFSRGSSWPRDWSQVSCLGGRFFTTELPGQSICLLKSSVCLYLRSIHFTVC